MEVERPAPVYGISDVNVNPSECGGKRRVHTTSECGGKRRVHTTRIIMLLVQDEGRV